MADIKTHSDARRVEEVLENIYRIPVVLPNNPLKELNSYLIRDPERSILIDTGFRAPECRDALLAGLGEIGEDPGSVDIFLTHQHADHSGLAPDIVGDGRRILISEVDGRIMAGITTSVGEWISNKMLDTLTGMPSEIVECMDEISPAIRFAPKHGARYTFVRDGEMLHAGGYSLRCVLTPGHTPGHTCLWDEGCGLMFTGDHVLFNITPNITAWPSVSDSLGDYLNSLRKAQAYPVKTALPAHRQSGGFHKRIDELFKHHTARLAEVEGIIRSDPGLSAYEIAGRMHWNIRARNWDEFPPPQKIFAVGECLSHLDYLRLRGAIAREQAGMVYIYRGAAPNEAPNETPNEAPVALVAPVVPMAPVEAVAESGNL